MNKQPIVIQVPGLKQNVGAGDVIKSLTDKLGIKLENCRCNQRQQYLNSVLQFAKGK